MDNKSPDRRLFFSSRRTGVSGGFRHRRASVTLFSRAVGILQRPFATVLAALHSSYDVKGNQFERRGISTTGRICKIVSYMLKTGRRGAASDAPTGNGSASSRGVWTMTAPPEPVGAVRKRNVVCLERLRWTGVGPLRSTTHSRAIDLGQTDNRPYQSETASSSPRAVASASNGPMKLSRMTVLHSLSAVGETARPWASVGGCLALLVRCS